MSDTPFGAMRPFGAILTLAQAQSRIDAEVRPVEGDEPVALADALARVLAEDVIARFDVPGFDRAAMDGYAVRVEDVAVAREDAPVWLTLAGRARPGSLSDGPVAPGHCVEIATGAPVPEGASAVVMVEHTLREGMRVRFACSTTAGNHISRRASDMAAGARVLRAGQWLTPARAGLAASLGVRDLTVLRRPIVALISSGDELLDATEGDASAPAPGRIYDANRETLAAVCTANGAHVQRLPIVRDHLASWNAALDAAADADLIVCSGGSSVGEQDLCLDAVGARGTILFHGIAVKPGKPTAFARIGSQLVLAMPGNPTSCLSNGYVLLRPLVRALAGLPPHVPQVREGTLTRPLRSPVDRLQFYPVRLDDDRGVTPVFKGSGDVTSLSDADGYVEVPVGVTEVAAGTLVRVTMY